MLGVGREKVRTTRLRIVGPYAQSGVPRAIATARDALSNDGRKSTTRFERPAKQALALTTEPRVKREAISVLLIYLSVVR